MYITDSEVKNDGIDTVEDVMKVTGALLSQDDFYGERVEVLDIEIADNGSLSGKFRNVSNNRVFQFKINGEDVSYRPYLRHRRKDSTEHEAMLQWVKLSLPVERTDAKFNKKCKDKSYRCGNTCISILHECHVKAGEGDRKNRKSKTANLRGKRLQKLQARAAAVKKESPELSNVLSKKAADIKKQRDMRASEKWRQRKTAKKTGDRPVYEKVKGPSKQREQFVEKIAKTEAEIKDKDAARKVLKERAAKESNVVRGLRDKYANAKTPAEKQAILKEITAQKKRDKKANVEAGRKAVEKRKAEKKESSDRSTENLSSTAQRGKEAVEKRKAEKDTNPKPKPKMVLARDFKSFKSWKDSLPEPVEKQGGFDVKKYNRGTSRWERKKVDGITLDESIGIEERGKKYHLYNLKTGEELSFAKGRNKKQSVELSKVLIQSNILNKDISKKDIDRATVDFKNAIALPGQYGEKALTIAENHQLSDLEKSENDQRLLNEKKKRSERSANARRVQKEKELEERKIRERTRREENLKRESIKARESMSVLNAEEIEKYRHQAKDRYKNYGQSDPSSDVIDQEAANIYKQEKQEQEWSRRFIEREEKQRIEREGNLENAAKFMPKERVDIARKVSSNDDSKMKGPADEAIQVHKQLTKKNKANMSSNQQKHQRELASATYDRLKEGLRTQSGGEYVHIVDNGLMVKTKSIVPKGQKDSDFIVTPVPTPDRDKFNQKTMIYESGHRSNTRYSVVHKQSGLRVTGGKKQDSLTAAFLLNKGVNLNAKDIQDFVNGNTENLMANNKLKDIGELHSIVQLKNGNGWAKDDDSMPEVLQRAIAKTDVKEDTLSRLGKKQYGEEITSRLNRGLNNLSLSLSEYPINNDYWESQKTTQTEIKTIPGKDAVIERDLFGNETELSPAVPATEREVIKLPEADNLKDYSRGSELFEKASAKAQKEEKKANVGVSNSQQQYIAQQVLQEMKAGRIVPASVEEGTTATVPNLVIDIPGTGGTYSIPRTPYAIEIFLKGMGIKPKNIEELANKLKFDSYFSDRYPLTRYFEFYLPPSESDRSRFYRQNNIIKIR
jgi:hypothetical protein